MSVQLNVMVCRFYSACVASVSSRGSSRKLGQDRSKKKMNDGGGGVGSNVRAITRLETLATQAIFY